MKPWPETLAKLYPLDPRLPNPKRPWWRRDPDPEFTKRMAERPDGYGCALFDFDVMKRIDTRVPMPHPGFRVGQVWAWLAEDRWVVFTLVSYLEGVYLDSLGVEVLEDKMLVRYTDSYLVADPCCPHLAPWAPPETP